MLVCTQKMRKQWVLCSDIILQYKTCQINLMANKLSKNNYPNKHHTFEEYVTQFVFFGLSWSQCPICIHMQTHRYIYRHTKTNMVGQFSLGTHRQKWTHKNT